MSYVKLEDTYKPLYKNKENFFVSYAVLGNIIDKETGVRADMPSLYPQTYSPHQPSPLNNRYKYIPKISYVGIV
jgi:hypothetical protein